MAITTVSTARGDLDGDGREETIKLFSDGVLRVYRGEQELSDRFGNAAGSLAPFESLARGAYGEGEEALRVVDIDRRDRQRELMLVEMRGDEDPAAECSFWVYREGHLWPMMRRIGTSERAFSLPHGMRPAIAGDGVVRAQFEQCVRDADLANHTRGIAERVTLRYTLSDGALPQGELSESIQTARHASDCVMAACPVVRVGRGEHRVGEVLRDLRAPSLERWQSLAIDPAWIERDGALTITLREEKRELTQLDGVYLEADGRSLRPEDCDAGDARWCRADGVHESLAPGQSLTLRFRVGAARAMRLWARGYYQPFDARGEPL